MVGEFASNELERTWKEAVGFTAEIIVQRLLSITQKHYRLIPFAWFPLVQTRQ